MADTLSDDDDPGRGAHLLKNRPQILLRSLLVGAAGLVPIPPLSDYLTEALRRGLLRHVAQARQVDIDDAAIDILAARSSEPRVGTVARLTGLLLSLRPMRWSRRLLGAAVLLEQAEEALHTFQQATLLDHYCARHHLGPGIDAARAQALRAHIEESGRTTRREVASEALQRALAATGRALSAVPRRLLSGQKEEPDAAPVPVALVTEAESHRLVRDAGLHRYSRRLAAAFDRRWPRDPKGPTVPVEGKRRDQKE